MYKKSLFIFRRDLRLHDNTGLQAALATSEHVLACFIFDPRQVEKNEYKNDNILQFMVESLQDLQDQLKAAGGKLYFFYGEQDKVVKQLVENEGIDAVYCNRDYTPFSRKRDVALKRVSPSFHTYDDVLLHPPEAVHKDDGKPYTVFTPYYKRAQLIPIATPKKNTKTNYYTKKVALEDDHIFVELKKLDNPDLFVHGGRSQGLKLLAKAKKLVTYKESRDIPAEHGTTGLSAHNKFGTLSPREVFHALKTNEPLARQLYWRGFFTQIAYFFDRVFGHAYQEQYDAVSWSHSQKAFDAWCEGKTGFPIVDAGMRELTTTGYMHNRTRMIVASFLTKDLHIDWRWGEKFFAQHLVDYDPAVNNGSWQWAASTGTDAQPYFRIFNPWLQQKRFDPDCIYIKKWLPELKTVPVAVIHNLEKERVEGYPAPIVVHSEEKDIAIARFKSVAQKKG